MCRAKPDHWLFYLRLNKQPTKIKWVLHHESAIILLSYLSERFILILLLKGVPLIINIQQSLVNPPFIPLTPGTVEVTTYNGEGYKID
jgi:hypothetical protein